MKAIKICGVSLGSSARDFRAEFSLAGVDYEIQRCGTDGELAKAIDLIKSLDGRVAAIGLGGVNLAYVLGARHYPIREGTALAQAARVTPVVDGAFVKELWEPCLIRELASSGRLILRGKQVLLSSALDRYHLGVCLEQLGARVWVGDALLALKLPLLFPTVRSFALAGIAAMPLLSRLPLKFLYPLGKKQESRKQGWNFLLHSMDVFAGDFHLINRYLPPSLTGKSLLTSTLTADDRQELARRGAAHIYPLGLTFSGRSFGANIVDALLTAAAGLGVYGTQDKAQVLKVVLQSRLDTYQATQDA